MTPRSSCPGGDPLFSRAQTSGSITNSTLYRKTARGWGTCRPSSAQASRAVVAQLQTTWVTFDKQTWVTSPARRRRSAIVEKTLPLVEELTRVFPKAIVGGTGSGSASRLEEIGVSGFEQDYSLY